METLPVPLLCSDYSLIIFLITYITNFKESKRRSLVKSLKTRAFDCQSAIADWQSKARVFKLLTRERLFNSLIMSPGYSSIFNTNFIS